MNILWALRTDKDIDAILIRIDSPGGAVAPSQEIAEAVKRARKDKRVICSMGTVAASGGYYVASQCDRILASPGTITAYECTIDQQVINLVRGGQGVSGSPSARSSPTSTPPSPTSPTKRTPR